MLQRLLTLPLLSPHAFGRSLLHAVRERHRERRALPRRLRRGIRCTQSFKCCYCRLLHRRIPSHPVRLVQSPVLVGLPSLTDSVGTDKAGPAEGQRRRALTHAVVASARRGEGFARVAHHHPGGRPGGVALAGIPRHKAPHRVGEGALGNLPLNVRPNTGRLPHVAVLVPPPCRNIRMRTHKARRAVAQRPRRIRRSASPSAPSSAGAVGRRRFAVVAGARCCPLAADLAQSDVRHCPETVPPPHHALYAAAHALGADNH